MEISTYHWGLLAISLAVLFIGSVQPQGYKIGKFDVLFKHSEPCPLDGNDKYQWNFTIKTKKLSRKATAISFTAIPNRPIDKNIDAQVDVSVASGNGGWKPNFFNVHITDLCNYLKSQKNVFRQLAENSNITAKCPLPKAPIALKNYIVNIDDYTLPKMLPFVSLMVDVSFVDGKKKFACIKSYVDLVPAKQ